MMKIAAGAMGRVLMREKWDGYATGITVNI